MRRFSLIVAILMLFFVVQGCVQNRESSTQHNQQQQDTVQEQEGAQNVKDDTQDQNENHDQNEQNHQDTDGDLDQDSNQDGQANNPENIVYVSADRLNVRKEPDANAEKIGQLMQGSSIEILDEKIREEDGTKWLYISYGAGDQALEGWISSEYTVADRTELLSPDLKALDFSPQNKVTEYPENPRVKVKGVYLTIYSASGSRLDSLIEMAKRTDINTFVIDVKDDNGHMLFYTKAAEKYAPKANELTPIKDIEAFMKKLKDNNIYTIARIVTFKDPIYTEQYPERAILDKRTGKAHVQKDGLRWASPHDRQLWEYDVAVAKEAARVGFNEIQFDYVRFPDSGGGKLDQYLDYRNTNGESKPETIQNFLKYAYEELSKEKVYIGADIYGLVASVTDDMGLGQYWEAISNVVDYVCPMMYPSHYANHTYQLPIPDAYPYETIYHSARDAVMRNKNIPTPAIIRPWIQDFTATWVKGHIKYGEEEVRAQIKALEDNGIDEFMLWNPGNRYTEEAVK